MAGRKNDKTDTKRYIVIPRNPQTANEGFAFVSTGERARPMRVPFERPVFLTDAEVSALKRQREAIQVDKKIDVTEIMERHQVPQTIANKMAQATTNDTSMGGKKIEFVTKYIITAA